MIVSDDEEDRCPENCDRGLVKSCPEDAGHPCPMCQDGFLRLQEAIEAHYREQLMLLSPNKVLA